MPDESPGMRPLYIEERAASTLYGFLPTGIMQIPLRAMLMLLERPECGAFWRAILHTVMGFGCLDTDWLSERIDLPFTLAWGMYGVFYFTFGRSLGHMVVDANIVHHRTGRPMRTWQKVVRSGLQVLIGSSSTWTLLPGASTFWAVVWFGDLFWVLMWFVSAALVLLDRRRRRSLFDLVAGTVVVVGEPTEEEPEEARESVLNRVMGRLTGRAGVAERG